MFDVMGVQFDLLHVGPPCSPVRVLREHAAAGGSLTDAAGWMRVLEGSLQSTQHPNVFALGDCAGTTNKKTAAAVGECGDHPSTAPAHQLRTLVPNVQSVLSTGEVRVDYDGYASCPLLTDSRHVILSEFNHQGPVETLPLNQARPGRGFYWLTRYFLPWLYWNLHLRGRWQGPRGLRRLLRFGRA